MIHEERAVRQACERVVEGVVQELLFGSLAVGDVLNLEDEVQGVGLSVADERHAEVRPDLFAVLVRVAQFGLVR